MDSFVSGSFVLWFLSFYNLIFDITGSSLHLLKEILNAVKNVFRPKYYILFDGIPTAYDANTVAPYATGSAEPRWVFSPEDISFFEWNRTVYNTVHNFELQSKFLPVLSLEIVNKEDESVHYDLTDFLEQIKVRTTSEEDAYPSISDLIAAWTTRSGIVPNSKKFKASIFTKDAVSMNLDLTDTCPVNCLNEQNVEEDENRLSREESESDISVSASGESGSSTKED